ncbi:serine hydrolase [Flavobacteriaceae bacterium AU392]|nr:tetratricopeptide repeat protein [Flavobacteriaceae bacterium]RKM85990.1 serine hydrolase [Flavobacteriaceae bacterium AU392]
MRKTKTIINTSILFFLLIWQGCFSQVKKNILNEKEIASKIDALVKQYTSLDIFSGVVLVAENGKPIYHKAFGLADREKGIPNTLNTKFDIGSMNKTFTKVLILQLIDEGKLSFDDTIGKHLIGFPEMAANNITVEHLLYHFSGYGDYWSPDFKKLPTKQKTIQGLLERIKKMPLLFEPGSENEYSNSGYIILGAIVEKITGKSYHKNIQERIVTPLNLENTYVESTLKSKISNRAIGYYKDIKGNLLNNNDFVELPNPDGGFQATTLDIMKFYKEFFYGNSILREEAKMEDEFYRQLERHRTTGGAIPHYGGFEGANTALYEILRDKITIAVFANMDEPVAEQIGPGILAIIRGQKPKKPSLPAIQNVYKHYNEKGLDYVKTNFKNLISNFHPTDPKSLILNRIGYTFLRENKIDKALDIFKLNTELFPENPNVWDSLGEIYLKKGDTKTALKNYEKALTLDPEFESAKRKVEQLKLKN